MTGFQYDRYFLGKDQYGSRHSILIQLTIDDLSSNSKLNSNQPTHQIQDFKDKKKKSLQGQLGVKVNDFTSPLFPVYT